MPETRLIMGMPITISIVGDVDGGATEAAFECFESVDRRFSPYKIDSEVSALNRGEIALEEMSPELREVLELSELTRHETQGYFDIRRPDGRIDPSGLVKGWAIRKAARGIEAGGHFDYFVDAGGDIQCRGRNEHGKPWRVGIRNPFDQSQIVKVLVPGDDYTLAEPAYWPWIVRVDRVGGSLDAFPAIRAWLERLDARPEYRVEHELLGLGATPGSRAAR